MADNLRKRGSPDSKTINMKEAWEKNTGSGSSAFLVKPSQARCGRSASPRRKSRLT
jgi:hypothetical protein